LRTERAVLPNCLRLHAVTAIGATCALLACGDRSDAPPSSDLPQVSAARLEEHIRYLASDRLAGRGTGTPGYDSAARYVAERFAELRLDSAGTSGYFQPVPFRRARAVDGSGLVLIGRSGRRALTPYRDYIPVPNFVEPRAEVTAPLVFAGFGVTAPERGYDDYGGVDAKGKIVVLLTGAPSSFPAAERAHYASNRLKRENAVGRGAVGLLVVRTRDQTFPWDRAVRQSRRGSMRWLDRSGAPTDVSPALRGAATLSDSSAAQVFEGAPQSLTQVLDAAAAGKPPAFDLPLRATLRTASTYQRLESPNVAGLLRGSDPRLRDEVVVYTAHLDHLGIGEPVKGDSIYNGALDNASGSAALLEVARAFASLPTPARRSVMFVAVTGEEEGLLGSDYFAQHPTVPLEQIVANVNIDGLGILYPFREMSALGAEHSTLDSTVARVARRMGVTVAPDPFPQEVFFIRSDQYSFVRRGVPALFPFLGLRSDSGVDAAARFKEWLATRYHTPQDDVDQPMDLAAGARNAQLEFLVGLDIANADERPRWKPGDFFGSTFGKRADSRSEAGSSP
jgi:Zn-dependent M28 family amino/carboxypeptidase